MNGKQSDRGIRAESALTSSLLARYGDSEEARELIASALVFWRRGAAATARLDAEGLTVQTRGGLWRHPLVAVEREARLGFAALLRVLDDRVRRRRDGRPTKVEALGAPRSTTATRRYLRRAPAAGG